MQTRSITIFILTAFVAGTLLLVYIEYDSSKNINALISGNEKLMSESKVSAELQSLEKNVLMVETKVRGLISTEDTSYIEGVDSNISEVMSNLRLLKAVSDDDKSILFISRIDQLVRQKIAFDKQLIDTLEMDGKPAAEKLLSAGYGKLLSDSIVKVTQQFDSTRKKNLTDASVVVENSGEKAKKFSLTLIVLVLVSAAFFFWYIVNIIRKQVRLIQQLNISEKKVKEAARVKENFLANMSHEIRTPMNAIIGFTSLLQHKQLDDESKGFVQTIGRSGENLLAIINDILDLSKIEAGMLRIESSHFSIRELLHSVEVMLQPRAREKQLVFSVVVHSDMPDHLEGDATRLTQILVNLIGNALKFTHTGSVKVSVGIEDIKDDMVKTGISVADTGIGIHKEKLLHIFDRFEQAEEANTKTYGGTGLGLSIVKELVLLQHGTIDVSSEPGNGTVFKIVLPYKITKEEINRHSLPVVAEHRQVFDDATILVVEDNEINQSLIKHLFRNWGLSYELAKNGREAIELLQQKPFNLILMDIQMPEMDGLTATREIRNKLKINTPIIAMTAHAMAGEREKCIGHGMNDYISKPLRDVQLYELIAPYMQVNQGLAAKNNHLSDAGGFKMIDLQYMKQISGGNLEYEKTVTKQFIEAILNDLQEIEKAWKDKHINSLRQLAHNMKTTISIMGLTETLGPFLDAVEHHDLNEESFHTYFRTISEICSMAVEEANLFLKSL